MTPLTGLAPVFRREFERAVMHDRQAEASRQRHEVLPESGLLQAGQENDLSSRRQDSSHHSQVP